MTIKSVFNEPLIVKDEKKGGNHQKKKKKKKTTKVKKKRKKGKKTEHKTSLETRGSFEQKSNDYKFLVLLI